jgi:hypothetical protein
VFYININWRKNRGLEYEHHLKAAMVVSAFSLLINCGQLLFALIGPDI